MTTNKLISRQEVLEGLTGRATKRASMALTLLENQTVHLAAQAQPPLELLLAEQTLRARNQAFLAALAQDREASQRPTIQELERYAPQWATLAPADVTIRAALAHLLGQRYHFTQAATPQLRLALGLDSDAVQQAYQRLFGQPLSTIYAPRPTLGERWRWGWATFAKRLETLPPFWITFALTLPGAAGLLALPIALAQVGLTTGLLLLLLFGLINLLTVTALAETVARSGTMRFGLGFLGQLMQEYLGPAGSLLMTLTLALNNFFVLIIFYIGVGGTLADATRLPAPLWIAVIFGVCLYFLSRKSLNATVATTLLIVFVNIFTLFMIPLLTLPHFRVANLVLGQSGWLGEQTVSTATLELIFGILLSTYFSHMQVASYGPVILRRDPSARSWIRGSAVAILFYMLIGCLWLIVMNGAIPAAILVNTPGTVLEPLAARVGPLIHLLGSWLVVCSMGLTSLQIALGLYYLVQERLPTTLPGKGFNPLGERVRFWLAASPVAAVFVLAEWVALTGVGTFASLLGIISALFLPLLAGVFPVLLLAATRRKGDFSPGVVYRLLGHPIMLTLIYLFFLAIILLHGLVIWQNPVTRAAALLVVMVVAGGTVVMLRRRMFSPRLVVEVRKDATDQASVAARMGDQAIVAEIQQEEEAGARPVHPALAGVKPVRSIKLRLPITKAIEIKVWVHQVTPEGDSIGLPAHLLIQQGDSALTFDLTPTERQISAPLTGELGAVTVHTTFSEST